MPGQNKAITVDNIQWHLHTADLAGITAESVATALGVSVKTLRRAARQDGFTFKQLLDAERKRRCDLLLAERKPYVGLVQRVTGYDSCGSVTRAFRRWYGVTLEDFKRRHYGQKA